MALNDLVSSIPLTCRLCRSEMQPGQVLVPGTFGTSDFGGDHGQPGTTRTEGPGSGKPQACLKCPKCGHSFIPASKA